MGTILYDSAGRPIALDNPLPTQLVGRKVTDDVTLQNGAVAVGPGQRMSVDGLDTAVLTVSGTLNGTITWQVSTVADPQTDADWENKFAQRIGTGVDATTATATGIYVMSVSGLRWVRANVTALTAGPVTVKGRAIAGTTPSKAVLAALQNVEGTPGQVAPSKAVQMGATDGTNLRVLRTGATDTVALDFTGLAVVPYVYDATNGLVKRLNSGHRDAMDPNLASAMAMMGYNDGSGKFDRWRSNLDLTMLASAARTATVTSADQTNYNARGALIIINVTSVTGAPSITPDIATKDINSGNYQAIAYGAAITGVGTYVLMVYPAPMNEPTAIANLTQVQIPLPRTWRLRLVHANADSIVYNATVQYVL